jgi:hypothetical protein
MREERESNEVSFGLCDEKVLEFVTIIVPASPQIR